MRILVLGAGGVGGYFGGRLAEAGADVTFLVRPHRKESLQKDGLRISSSAGDYKGPVKAATQEELDGSWDIVLLTCKSYDLDSAIEAIRPAVGPSTAVLPLLNGMEHMERLNQEFGVTHVLGGTALISATLEPDGSIRHLSDWAALTFGEQDGSMSARVVGLRDAFPTASVSAEAVPDIMQKMWNKVVPLSTAAGLACLMRASLKEIAAAPGGIQLIVQLLEVNAEIAAREGYRLSEDFLAERREFLTNPPYRFTPSMLVDIERHNQVEGEHVTGFMFRKAKEHGLDTSVHSLIDIHLKSYELRRSTNCL